MNKAATLKTQQSLTEDQLNQLRAVINELKDVSDHELQKKIENHQADLDAAYSERKALVQRGSDERDAQDKLERKRGIAQATQGNLQAQKDRYEENLVTRQKLIREIATRHDISGYDHDLDEDEVTGFMDTLEAAIKEQGKKIEKIKVRFFSRLIAAER